MNSPVPTQPAVFIPWHEPIWLALTFLTFLVWWAFYARRCSAGLTLPERILAAFISTTAQITATVTLAGWLHQLGWWQLFIPNALITLGLAAWVGIKNEGRSFAEEFEHFCISAWSVFRSSVAVQAISIIVLLAAGWVIYLGQLLPPYCWDAWYYHYGWAALANQEGHLGPFNIPDPYINFYPKNADILFLWWIIGAGTDRWANLAQAPFGFASSLACYILARNIGASRKDSAFTGLLVFSIPTVIHQMWMGMADLTLMGLVLIPLAFLSRPRLNLTAVALAGISAGIAAGAKGTAAFWLIGIVGFLLYRLLLLRNFKGLIKGVALFGVLAVVFGSYFYLQNWVRTGNPTGFIEVKLGSHTLFEGDIDPMEFPWRAQLPEEIFNAMQEGKEWPIVFDGFFDPQIPFYQGNRIGGWGSTWTMLLLPAIPAAILIALLKKRWDIILLMASLLVPYYLFPNHTWTRFLLPVCAVGCISFVFLLKVLQNTGYRRFLLATACALTIATLVIAVPTTILDTGKIADARKTPYLQNDRYAHFVSWGDRNYAEALTSVIQPGTTLAFTGIPPKKKVLALWNPTYSNTAVYVPWESDGPTWEQALRDKGADAVLIFLDTDSYNWAARHTQSFNTLYGGGLGGIFQVIYPDDTERSGN